MNISFPYGKSSIELELPDDKTSVIYSKIPRGVPPIECYKLIEKSLSNPIGTEPLERLVRGAKSISILITDKTRATPNRMILEALLPNLRELNVPSESIKIIVATGLHEPHGRQEIIELVGKEISNEYEVLSHDSDKDEDLVYLGRTSFGTEVYVNKNVVESDLIIGIGLIEPHFFAGYSGGRKLILPGISGTRTVYQNHSYKMLAHPKADYGYLDGNPIHEDMLEASKMVKNYKFIIHVILDKEKNIVNVVAGDPYRAHRAGVNILDKYVKIPVPFKADITIVTNGGYPLDRNLYQAVKGMVTGSRVTKRGGIVIMFAECIDGVGHEHFRELASIDKDPKRILEYIEKNEPLRDQWEVQKLEQVLMNNKVIVVTKNIKHSTLEEMNLIPASTAEEALELAYKKTKCEKMLAIPEGPYVIPIYEHISH